MYNSFFIDRVFRENLIETEFVYNLAMAEENRLRILCKTHPSFKDKRMLLRDIIEEYEKRTDI